LYEFYTKWTHNGRSHLSDRTIYLRNYRSHFEKKNVLGGGGIL
jgi:hypothetical protein